ncbi:MAG TPA: DegT/DnrJ/EryC1/StrS family aminotransferase [Armatimonadota bacterium]|nr:DegT/DnrJ/EryC1/StrS family aminotransferase [Armatimonadota bacterium]
MTVAERTTLAIQGGDPVRKTPLPSGLHGIMEVGQEEIDAVTDVLRRQAIFRYLRPDEESYCGRLEQAYCEFTGKRFACAVTGGTSALISALVGLGISTGDEVIVPAYTYIATPAAVLTVGGIPVIAEVDDTLTLDPADLERKITPLTRCIVPVHMRGLPAQMDAIMDVARRHNLLVLEDCAQANGGEYHGKRLGGIGDVGIFSFQHYKIITSGEGGMVVTDDSNIYHRARYRHDSAVRFFNDEGGPEPFAGENARMCELRGAVGLTQFGRLAGILERTRAVKRRIVAGISGTPGIEIQRVADPEGDCGITVIVYLPDAGAARSFARALSAEGIGNGTIYNQGFPDRHIYKHWDYVINKWTSDRTGYPWAPQYYKGSVEYSPDMCPNTLDYLGRAVAISISQAFTDRDADDIIEGIRKVAYALR